MSQIQVLIVEDDPLIANDIEELLSNADYDVAGIAYNKEGAFKILDQKSIDFAILDINLGNNLDGFDVAKHINENYNIPFIYLTSYSSKHVVSEAKLTRPMGYLVKPFDEADLTSSIEIALYNHGLLFKPKTLSRELINQRMLADISKKEFEILQDLFSGLSNRQMADQHFVSVNTIKTHVQKLYDKLQTHSRSETTALVRKFLD